MPTSTAPFFASEILLAAPHGGPPLIALIILAVIILAGFGVFGSKEAKKHRGGGSRTPRKRSPRKPKAA
jgi:hypothetical protein